MLIYREPDSEDFALVADSFFKGVRECPSVFGLRRDFLMKMLSDVIIKPDWKITLLVDDNQVDEVFAWCVWKSPSQIFWVATKPRYKGLGFGAALLRHIGVPDRQTGEWFTVSCPILPPGLLIPAHKRGIKLVQRPYLSME